MSINPAHELSTRFSKKVSSFEVTRKKLEFAYDNKLINLNDIERVYDGLFLNIVAAYENFLEELFFGLLLEKRYLKSRIKPKVQYKNEQIARTILQGNQQYLKWLPYDSTQRVANMYFRNGKPFTNLNNSDTEIIQEIVWVRNAVAHKSSHAIKKFKDNVIKGKSLTTRERTPSGYLRGNFRTSPQTTRYENLVFSLVLISKKLTE